jgi:serine/threonine protein kinase
MGKLKILDGLGCGSYGTVYLVQDLDTSEILVLKKILVTGMKDAEIADCKREIQILAMMDHPHVVRYVRSFVRKGALCIVMEYADGGDLYQLIKQRKAEQRLFAEDRLLDWMAQIGSALRHVHKHNILHRDLKTQNVFLTKSGNAILGDFGISRVLGQTIDHAQTLVGTPYYLSPEMVNGKSYDQKSDIWALGVVFYEMLTLQHPFLADSLQMLAIRILQGSYPPIDMQYSVLTSDLISKMLCKDPAERLDIDGVLNHPALKARVEKLEKNWIETRKSTEISRPRVSIDSKSIPEHKRAIAESGGPTSGLPQIPPGPNFLEKQKHQLDIASQAAEEEEYQDLEGAENLDAEEPSIEESIPRFSQDLESEPRASSSSASPRRRSTVPLSGQALVLKNFLETRLGAKRLARLMVVLRNPILSDNAKEEMVEQLIQGKKSILSFVHTYEFLSRAPSSYPTPI